MKRRDQIIAFYLVILAALIGSWNKLGEIQIVIAFGAWVLGIACFIVLTQYWRWQVVLHLSLVTVQALMHSDRDHNINDCERIWNTVNETDRSVFSFLNPFHGVEINIIYLFATITFIPAYLVYRNYELAIFLLKSEVVAFILDAILYTFILAFISSLYVKRFSIFQERHWMFRWLRAIENNNEGQDTEQMGT